MSATLDEQVAMVADCVADGLTTVIRGVAMLHEATGAGRGLCLDLVLAVLARRNQGGRPAEHPALGDDGPWW
ncbi:MAG: hypothetical protein ACRDQ0_03810 [Pseudonocardia sp.]